ncbi:MAG TPA: hypothetical protein VH092_27650 [Urbifossiella sp.]|nr:hypothetical protein [Urbifossiella sp.]
MVAAARGGASLRSVARQFGAHLRTVPAWVGWADDQRLDRVDWSDRPRGGRRESATTAADGSYSFSGLAAGPYEAQFVAPTGDSVASPPSGRTGTFALAAAQTREWDAGVYGSDLHTTDGRGGSI